MMEDMEAVCMNGASSRETANSTKSDGDIESVYGFPMHRLGKNKKQKRNFLLSGMCSKQTPTRMVVWIRVTLDNEHRTMKTQMLHNFTGSTKQTPTKIDAWSRADTSSAGTFLNEKHPLLPPLTYSR